MAKSSKQVVETVITFAAAAPFFTAEGAKFKALVHAWDTAGAAFTTGTTALFSEYADQCRTTSGLSKLTLDNVKLSIKAIRAAIMDDESVVEMVSVGMVPKATFSNYAQSVCRAWFHGIDYAPGLFNKPELAIPGLRTQASKAKQAAAKSSKAKATKGSAAAIVESEAPALTGTIEHATKMYISFLRAHGANELADSVFNLFTE